MRSCQDTRDAVSMITHCFRFRFLEPEQGTEHGLSRAEKETRLKALDSLAKEEQRALEKLAGTAVFRRILEKLSPLE